jgi:glycosidase
MNALAARPSIYEVDTWVWLQSLGGITLDQVDDARWAEIAALGFDAVWLMGVWERSPAGLGIAVCDEGILSSCARALGDSFDATVDMVGSPYCIRGYAVDAALGGEAGLAAARAALAAHGLGLILDFVPNHVAADHPWTRAHPEYFVRGSRDEVREHPEAFLEFEDQVLARGRDPYFPPWPDVVQLNAFSAELRDAAAATLVAIGDRCDGVRCDMAMLMLDEVFARTWGERVDSPLTQPYWPQVIGAARAAHPGMRFIAEAYWDMEAALQAQGFDHCYDKRLYDRLEGGDAGGVRAHLGADLDYQDGLIRFIENHDEPRAAATFGTGGRARAAAVASTLLPGALLIHDGQLEGRRVQLPVFLARRPDEEPDAALHAFYERVLAVRSEPWLRDATWALASTGGWPDNASHEQLVAWTWTGGERLLVVVNLADAPAQARVQVPWADLAGATWTLTDALTDAVFDRDGDELRADGLYVELPSNGVHVLHLRG